MNQPSFKNYLNTLSSILKHKGKWLQQESQDLAKICQEYGKHLQLSHHERKILLMAAYIKNLGALYVSDYLLEQEFRDHSHMVANLSTWFVESSNIAREAGLEEVAIILDQYHQRSIPQNKLARIFQVLNTWIACQQEKGWRHPMTPREAKIILEQRAHLQWSDPILVRHFIHHLNYSKTKYLGEPIPKSTV
jgi:hypothetical protein